MSDKNYQKPQNSPCNRSYAKNKRIDNIIARHHNNDKDKYCCQDPGSHIDKCNILHLFYPLKIPYRVQSLAQTCQHWQQKEYPVFPQLRNRKCKKSHQQYGDNKYYQLNCQHWWYYLCDLWTVIPVDRNIPGGCKVEAKVYKDAEIKCSGLCKDS